MRRTSIVCGVVFLFSLAAMPVIDYAGGRVCMPLAVPPLFLPAGIVPMGAAFFAAVCLLGVVIRSLVVGRDRRWTVGVLAVVIAATGAYRLASPHLPGYLEGLRNRFVSKVGYDQMRQFAAEVSEPNALAMPQGVLVGADRVDAPSSEQTDPWDDLASRYPFLDWNGGAGAIIARNGVVELTWGSPLVGHWGFQVTPGGEVTDLDPDDGWFLRVARDIQFVYYYD